MFKEQYVEEILERFGMADANSVKTPMNVGEKYSSDVVRSDEEVEQMKEIPYQEAIGCLLYLSQCTRPDICYAVNLFSRFCSKPTLQPWLGVKHLFRYLKGTKSMKIDYKRDVNLGCTIEAYMSTLIMLEKSLVVNQPQDTFS